MPDFTGGYDAVHAGSTITDLLNSLVVVSNPTKWRNVNQLSALSQPSSAGALARDFAISGGFARATRGITLPENPLATTSRAMEKMGASISGTNASGVVTASTAFSSLASINRFANSTPRFPAAPMLPGPFPAVGALAASQSIGDFIASTATFTTLPTLRTGMAALASWNTAWSSSALAQSAQLAAQSMRSIDVATLATINLAGTYAARVDDELRDDQFAAMVASIEDSFVHRHRLSRSSAHAAVRALIWIVQIASIYASMLYGPPSVTSIIAAIYMATNKFNADDTSKWFVDKMIPLSDDSTQ